MNYGRLAGITLQISFIILFQISFKISSLYLILFFICLSLFPLYNLNYQSKVSFLHTYVAICLYVVMFELLHILVSAHIIHKIWMCPFLE